MVHAFRRTLPAAAGALLLAAQASAATINFDDQPGGQLFVEGSELTGAYAAQGVTFGGDGHPGGSILSYLSNAAFDTRSGDNYLAFNPGAGATGNVQNIYFAGAAQQVSIWGSSYAGGSFTLNAYSIGGTLLASSSAAFAANGWTELSVSASGIARVQLIGNGEVYAYDDLSVSAVPEPATYGMLLAGLGLVGWARRRRG
ncbi:PEP-CTERM sorting domain-containing protein [Duganella callida]|uniref:PEP-CTERM sorting domain-containing protein n=1 Tax=Duganella callida TaxID=2561932 RepID=A0A4Y9SC56_9BURK|nr:PEP-CTERM sorting domain-containing protein [Duganella callida]TFW18203.1 PEP-CTERM sorting domain-containing protein [Duganella callida]